MAAGQKIMIGNDSPIKSVADLKGKKAGKMVSNALFKKDIINTEMLAEALKKVGK